MIYEYVCKHCGIKCELIVKVDDRDNQQCVECGNNLERKISLPACAQWSGDRNFSASMGKPTKERG